MATTTNRIKTPLLFLLLSCTISVAQNDLRLPFEPRPESLLPEFKDIKKIKSAEISHYKTDSVGAFLGYTNNKTIIVKNNYPKITLYYVDPKTKDTTQSKTVFTYHSKEDTLESYKEYRLGNTKHLFYDKKGRIQRKVEFFNQKKEGEFFWYYEGDNISKHERLLYGKKYTYEYKYNENKQLVEKVSYINTVYQGNSKWYFDANGNVIKEETTEKDKSIVTTRLYDEANQLIEKNTFVNNTLFESFDFRKTNSNLEKEKEKNEKREKFRQNKTFISYDKNGNWIVTKFLNDEKYYDFDVVDGNYYVTERVIRYK